MSAFDRKLRAFPVFAILLSVIFAWIAGADTDSVSAQERPVTGASFSSATSVHEDQRVTNAVLQNSTSEDRLRGGSSRGWTAAHGKPASRANDMVSLQSSDSGRSEADAKKRRSRPSTVPMARPVFMVSAARPVIPPVPEPVLETTRPENPDAVELSPVEPSPIPAGQQRGSELPSLESSAADVFTIQQPADLTPPPVMKTPASTREASDRPVLSATERFKQALEEERRRAITEQAGANEEAPKLPSLDDGSVELAPVAEMAEEQQALQGDSQERLELSADDPDFGLLDERARRFVRLKQQLMQLKTQLEQPVVTDGSEPQPLPDDQLQSNSREDQGASDKESGLNAFSENLLPPVEGDESHEASHSEATGQTPDPGEDIPTSREASAESDLTDAETGHQGAPLDHMNGEHEPDFEAGEPSNSKENQQSVNANGQSEAFEHAMVEGAPHAASEHAVVHGPIDRLGLANNLYAVGEYQLAMKMYEQTVTAELSAQQQMWTDYQMANCLRRMGRNAEASNRYRRIAEQPEAGWLSEQSRWWVDVLEQIRQLQSSLEEDAGTPDENLQSPFTGTPRDSKSTGIGTEKPVSKKSGSIKSGGTGPENGSYPSGGRKGAGTMPSASSGSSQLSSRSTKPPKERITHFAPAETEAKHGQH